MMSTGAAGQSCHVGKLNSSFFDESIQQEMGRRVARATGTVAVGRGREPATGWDRGSAGHLLPGGRRGRRIAPRTGRRFRRPGGLVEFPP
jgi:hypothetical protein